MEIQAVILVFYPSNLLSDSTFPLPFPVTKYNVDKQCVAEGEGGGV